MIYYIDSSRPKFPIFSWHSRIMFSLNDIKFWNCLITFTLQAACPCNRASSSFLWFEIFLLKFKIRLMQLIGMFKLFGDFFLFMCYFTRKTRLSNFSLLFPVWFLFYYDKVRNFGNDHQVIFLSVSVNSQKLIKIEQKKRKRLKEKMEKLEEALKSAGAPPEALKILREELTNNNNTTSLEQPNSKEGSHSPSPPTTSPYTPPITQSRTPTSEAPAATGDAKPWNYASMDLIASGTAFWQNYSGTCNINKYCLSWYLRSNRY